MASARYTLNITPEPPEEKREMTRKEKVANYWHYHKWHYIVGLAALLLVGSFVYEIVSQVKPDYQIALLSRSTIDPAALETLQVQLEQFADDRNGDGKIKLSVLEYVVQPAQEITGEPDAQATAVDPYTQMAGITKLSGDLQTGESMIFITSEPLVYQKQYGVFAYNDGSLPAADAPLAQERLGVRWGDCPALTALELGKEMYFDGTQGEDIQKVLADYTVLRRAVAGTALAGDEKAAAYAAQAGALFERLTAR